MKRKYAKIVFGLPLEGPFDYAIPDSLKAEVEIGKRVWVPFRDKRMVGYCVGKSEKSESSYTKEIISVLDSQPVFSKRFLAFLKQVSKKYFSSWGEIIESALPPYLRKGRKTDDASSDYLMDKNYEVDIPLLDEEVSARVRTMVEAIEKAEARNFLLFDDYLEPRKIDVFLKLSRAVLSQGKDVLVIVPELSIMQEIAEVFRKSFGVSRVLVYYGSLREKEGFLTWRLIRERFPKIIIGTRTAIYHPNESIGLIIVDEEGSPFHKQDEFPFYNARDVALVRARFFKIPLVLSGSAVSVETYYKAEKGDFTLIDLREKQRHFPQISLVDLSMPGRNLYISKPLELKINQVLNEGKRIILFLNRRGFATLIKCLKCNNIIKCRRCAQNLTYHFDIKKLVCHRCGYNTDVFTVCPQCHSSYLRYRGMGTEKLESELSRIFPQAQIARLDFDIKKEKAIESTLKDFRENRVDILLGTSLLVKGLSLPSVGLVGIINLEQGINFPDFRGSERLFFLLLGLIKLIYNKDDTGQLLIQTHNPQNKIITALRYFDYDSIYKEELDARKDLKLPPFRNLVILNLRGKNKKTVEKNAQELSRRLREYKRSKNIFISEAVPHPLYKLRDKYRWQIFVKSGSIEAVYRMLKFVLGGKRRFKGSILTVDVELRG